MRQIQFTRRAQRDLVEIWEYIARDNPDAADRVIGAMRDAVRLLAEHPGIGHPRADVSDPRYRFWRVYSYLLAYRATDETLLVIRIVHGARDLRRALRG